MSFALLQTALLLPAELLINQLLGLDPQSAARLEPFNQRTLALECTAPTLKIYLSVRQNRIHLSPISANPADATLSGSLSALLQLLLKGQSVHNLHGSGVSLQGSATLVSGLQQALLALDVDWEYQLSRVLGDLPTEALSRSVHTASSTLHRSRERLHEDLHDYLTVESGLLPSPAQAESFYHEIRQLILRADRLQAQLDLLASTRTPSQA